VAFVVPETVRATEQLDAASAVGVTAGATVENAADIVISDVKIAAADVS